MKLTKKNINDLVKTGRINGMPKGTYVAGFEDEAGGYYPLYMLDSFIVEGSEVELCTQLNRTFKGIEFYLRLITLGQEVKPPDEWDDLEEPLEPYF